MGRHQELRRTAAQATAGCRARSWKNCHGEHRRRHRSRCRPVVAFHLRFDADPPVRELLDGFDQIAPLPVPYDWLPGRAETFYGDRFQVWSDLADETIESLVNRPKGGIGTVRAILIAGGWEAAARAQAILPPDVGGGRHHSSVAARRSADRLRLPAAGSAGAGHCIPRRCR